MLFNRKEKTTKELGNYDALLCFMDGFGIPTYAFTKYSFSHYSPLSFFLQSIQRCMPWEIFQKCSWKDEKTRRITPRQKPPSFSDNAFQGHVWPHHCKIILIGHFSRRFIFFCRTQITVFLTFSDPSRSLMFWISQGMNPKKRSMLRHIDCTWNRLRHWSPS